MKYYLIDYLDGIESGTTNVGLLSSTVRRFILERENYTCQLCGWNEVHPISGTPPVEIHHKDGNGQNNRPENLQVLCPNCHSLTETYRARNKVSSRKERKRPTCIHCGGPASGWGKRCKKCVEHKTKIQWPEINALKQMVDELNYTQVGRQLGVSDNAVRSYIRRHS